MNERISGKSVPRLFSFCYQSVARYRSVVGGNWKKGWKQVYAQLHETYRIQLFSKKKRRYS